MASRSAGQRAAAAETTQAQAPASANLVNPPAARDGHRRDKLLEAVAVTARELLNTSDLSISLPKVAERIGTATGVDRVHIFLIDTMSAQGDILQHFVWILPGLPTPPDFRNAREPLANVGLKSWIARLACGETITGRVREFDPEKRAFFELGGVKSMMAMPVFAEDRWLGLIGFDDCRSERDWSAAEIDTLKTVTELVGAAIARASHLKTMNDAKRIVENSPTILYRLAPEPPHRLTYVSQNVSRYGYAAADLLANPSRWIELVAPDDLRRLMNKIGRLIDGEADRFRIDVRMKKPDGSLVWFDSDGYALRGPSGKLSGIEGILNDVTERKNSESRLTFSRILLTTAIEGSPDAILIVDAHGRIIELNRNFIELWNIPPELVRAGDDGPVLMTVASRMKNQAEFLARVRYLYDHPELQSHEELEAADGRIVDRHSGSLYDAQRSYLGRVWFFRDITEKKQAEKRIATLARTDPLTGLANRTAFLDRLNLEFARAKRAACRFAVHYIDLDHFKDVNDTLGHPMGDRLLQQVAQRLKSCLRETDLVARFGGDEFAVLQVDIADTTVIEALARKIGEVIARPYMIGNNQVSTTVSIGVVPYRSDIANPDVMMVKADLALYRAKNEGRNQFRFHVAELDDETRERMMIGEDLRHAVERGELELFYQPQVDLRSGLIVGLEALIRWNHPQRGLLLPKSFIPIAETTGTIGPIGGWIIAQACQQIKAWIERGIAPPVVAINLSGAQFKLASQIDRIVIDNLSRYRIAPERLEIELTESVLIETAQRHGEVFMRLKQAGVRFAIDDFGTGYSSLDYLRSFRVNRLKIDKRFVENVTTCADDAAIVRATIGLAQELGIDVLAEGVETAAQRDFLVAAGCKFAQGFYFGRPMTAEAATKWLLRDQPLMSA
jgi:diguanylate cyclase (GGDEF)-like protein/PAS domain S-box-containing protein